jgi:hypothetical protein
MRRRNKKSRSVKAPRYARAHGEEDQKEDDDEGAEEGREDDQDDVDLTPIREQLVTLTSAQRGAFQSLYTEEQCEAWGTKTKSQGVYDDGCRFALVASTTIFKRPTIVIGYSPARLAYLVECLDELATQIAAQKGDSHVASNAAALRAAAEISVSKATRTLRRKLKAIAGGLPVKRKTIANAASSRDHDVGQTLKGLAGLASDWLASTDAHVKVLVKDAALTDADVAAANGAVAALRAAREGKTLGGVDSDRDTPAVNRIEGRVLREMKWAMDCFDEAHEDDSTIARLVPSAATRAVLAPTRGEEDDDAPPAPPPAVSPPATASPPSEPPAAKT